MSSLLDLGLSSYCVDSRRVKAPAETLFFCLPGKRRDGHDFIGELYEQGCRHFVVTKVPDGFQKAHFHVVQNVLDCLQKTAQEHRQRLKIPIIGITGSNGKTITKEWLYSLLQPRMSVFRSPGSYNSQIGVPLSLLAIQDHHDIAIIEAGVSQSGEMSSLQAMIQPDFGLFTSFGSAHQEGFSSEKEKYLEKTSLFEHCEYWLSHPLENHVPKKNQRFVSENILEGVVLPFEDGASRDNIALILQFIHEWRPQWLNELKSKLGSLHRIDMRLEQKKGIRGNTLFSDYYNTDGEGLLNLLNWVSETPKTKKRILVVSSFPESDEDGLQWDIELRRAEINKVLWVGDLSEELRKRLNRNVDARHFLDTDELLESGILDALSNCTILLKGARSFQFERLERRLAQPTHGTVLTIDLGALRHNWDFLSKKLGSSTKKLVMMKATAYGSGLHQMSHFFEEHGADYIGVAFPNEGVALREKGIQLPILVLNCPITSVDLVVKYDLEPMIYSLEHLQEWIDSKKVIKAHLNINTGMNRLGVDEKEVGRLMKSLENQETVTVKSIMSHLSASEDAKKDRVTEEQIARFDKISSLVINHLQIKPLRHIANSQAVLRWPTAQFDMVRLGLTLYGYDTANTKSLLLPAHTLKTYVIQLRTLEAGATVGYGADHPLEHATTVATIPIGYADGIPRHLSFGKFTAFVRGKEVHGLGRICMDMLMLDVTNIPDIEVGDEVEIFGSSRPLDQFAKSAETIPYEILVNIGERVERLFING